MFEKLIVSEPEGAEFKNRRSYFVVSSVVVGVLFFSAVLFSIYAAEIGLGNSDFELTELLAPTDLAPVEQEKPQPQPPRTQAAAESQSLTPTRQANIARIDEPHITPTTASVVPNSSLSRPEGRFGHTKFDSNPAGGEVSGRQQLGEGVTPGGLSATSETVSEKPDLPPPPVINPRAVKPPPPQSLGVVNGRAADLPKPVYSVAARAVGAQGKVNVQVLIDETGRVVSASAIDGHPLLRPASQQAAMRARFTPTLLSKVPVKVTGVIVYNFVK